MGGTISHIVPSFTGGEWGPELYGRVDLEKYRSAARKLSNWIVHPHGGISNRAGTQYLGRSLTNDAIKLIPFQYNTEQAYMLVVDKTLIRFLMDGAWVVVAPTTGQDLSAGGLFKWTQIGATAEYYCELAAGGDPGVHITEKPATVRVDFTADPTLLSEGVVTALLAGEWDYGDPGTGWDTIIVRLSDDADPDVKGAAWIEGCAFIEVKPAPYPWGSDTAVRELRWTQSADVLFIFHADSKAVKITRTSHYAWTATMVASSSGWKGAVGPPTGLTRSKEWHGINSNGKYTWTLSGDNVPVGQYYMEKVGGGDPGFGSVYSPAPPAGGLREDSFGAQTVLTLGAIGALAVGEYAFGDVDALGFDTIYMNAGFVPNNRAKNYYQAQFRDHTYAVTLVDTAGEEGVASEGIDAGLYDQISWLPPAAFGEGHSHYNVYRKTRKGEGPFGWVGVSEGISTYYQGRNTAPDMAKGPPEWNLPFADTTVNPGLGMFFEQRLLLARPEQHPQTFWGSVVGFHMNFLQQLPIRDDDTYEFTLVANEVNEIIWLATLKELILGTAGGEWVVKPGGDLATLTSTSVDAKRHSRWGSQNVQPAIVGNEVLYVQRGGRNLRSIGYEFEQDGYSGLDLAVMARHLFRDQKISVIAYQRTPDPILWCVMDSGMLIGMTYSKEHQVFAWHQHNSLGGLFEDVAVLSAAAGADDEVYFVVSRSGERFIEKMTPRFLNEATEARKLDYAYFVDAGLHVDLGFGNSASVFGGLKHLEGEEIEVFADGVVMESQVVVDGQIDLGGDTARVVTAGLVVPFSAITMDLVPTGQAGPMQDATRAAVVATLQLQDTHKILVGPPDQAGTSLFSLADLGGEDLFSGPVEVAVEVVNSDTSQIEFQLSDPVPVTILSVVPKVAVGD